jgi:hypothetical protein
MLKYLAQSDKILRICSLKIHLPKRKVGIKRVKLNKNFILLLPTFRWYSNRCHRKAPSTNIARDKTKTKTTKKPYSFNKMRDTTKTKIKMDDGDSRR